MHLVQDIFFGVVPLCVLRPYCKVYSNQIFSVYFQMEC